MRIIGEIPHAEYKVSVLKMNDKVTIQIEDRLVSQSFAFRDGTGVRDISTATSLLTPEFLRKVDERFKDMRGDYLDAIGKLSANDLDDFDII